MHKSPYRKKGKPISTDEKWMVVQVFHQCDEERSAGPYVETQDAHTRTSSYTGIGRRFVPKIIQHFRANGDVPPPAEAGNRTTHPQDIPISQTTKIRELTFE